MTDNGPDRHIGYVCKTKLVMQVNDIKNISPATYIWYDNAAVGKNALGSMMSNVSDECGLSKRYTNHCIRSTCMNSKHWTSDVFSFHSIV
jgi:hypothetical protein